MIASTICAVLLVSQVALALPFSSILANLPTDITHVAFDNDTSQYVAYKSDGSLFGTYATNGTGSARKRSTATGSCAQLSVQEAQSLPGFSKIDQFAQSKLGNAAHQTLTNPPQFLESPANACVSNDVVQIQLSGSPSCTTQSSQTGGELVGTNGSVTLSLQQGFSESASWSVEQSSTIGLSITVGAEVGIPEIADITTSVTASTEFTNTVGQSATTTVNDMTTESLTLTSPAGKTCCATFNATTCTTHGQGQLRFLANGWIWYFYNSRVQGHFDWAFSIENILTNQDDRSSFLQFAGSISSNSNSKYQGLCQ